MQATNCHVCTFTFIVYVPSNIYYYPMWYNAHVVAS